MRGLNIPHYQVGTIKDLPMRCQFHIIIHDVIILDAEQQVRNQAISIKISIYTHDAEIKE